MALQSFSKLEGVIREHSQRKACVLREGNSFIWTNGILFLKDDLTFNSYFGDWVLNQATADGNVALINLFGGRLILDKIYQKSSIRDYFCEIFNSKLSEDNKLARPEEGLMLKLGNRTYASLFNSQRKPTFINSKTLDYAKESTNFYEIHAAQLKGVNGVLLVRGEDIHGFIFNLQIDEERKQYIESIPKVFTEM